MVENHFAPTEVGTDLGGSQIRFDRQWPIESMLAKRFSVLAKYGMGVFRLT